MARRPQGRMPVEDEGGDEMPFVQSARSLVGTVQDAVQRIGDAIIGGDFTGNARGQGALDLQVTRDDPAQVASGDKAIALGSYVKASGAHAVAIGYIAEASGQGSAAIGDSVIASGIQSAAIGAANQALAEGASAVGSGSTASGLYSSAIGNSCVVSALRSTAVGWSAESRVPYCVNISGPIILHAGGNILLNDEWMRVAAAEIVLSTGQIDLKTIADYTLSFPAGCHFFLSEVGVILTALTALTTQPTVRFGVSGNLAKHRAAALTTLLTAVYKREKWTPLVPEDGETSLSFGVTVGATATVLKGRAYWKGILVEDEV